MEDSRGVLRGHCILCGVSECASFQTKSANAKDCFCGYCGCPPTKHQKLGAQNTSSSGEATRNQPHLSRKSSEPGPSNTSTGKSKIEHPVEKPDISKRLTNRRIGVKVMTKFPTGSKHSDHQVAKSFPKLSQTLTKELDGPNDITAVWQMLVDECSKHFVKENPRNRKDYAEIGKKMYSRFPKIKMEGKKPWSKFTSSLSKKIRRERMKIACIPTPMTDHSVNTSGLTPNMRPRRMEAGAADINFEKWEKFKEILINETEKENPSTETMQEGIRNTFPMRTEMLRNQLSPTQIISQFKFFCSALFVEIELRELYGESTFERNILNMERLAARLVEGTDGKLWACWLEFENSICAGEARLVHVSHSSATLLEDAKLLNGQAPTILVLEENQTNKVTIQSFGYLMSAIESFRHALVLCLGMYHIFDLPYPASICPSLKFLETSLLGNGENCTPIFRNVKPAETDDTIQISARHENTHERVKSPPKLSKESSSHQKKFTKKKVKQETGSGSHANTKNTTEKTSCSAVPATQESSIQRPRRNQMVLRKLDYAKIRRYKEDLEKELEKDQPSLNVVAECIYTTFHRRTEMLRTNHTPDRVMSEFPFLHNAIYVNIELEALLGHNAYKKLLNNMPKLVAYIVKRFNGTNLLNRWIDFESSIAIDETRLVYILKNEGDFDASKLEYQNPTVLVIEEDEHRKLKLVLFGHAITGIKTFREALVLCLGTYYIFDWAFPSSAGPALNFLETCLLGVEQ